MPSVLFDAIALVVSEDGCAELLKDSAATDFVAHAFAHLKAIGHADAALPLLEKANVEADEGVIDLSGGMEDFVAQARTRLWKREAYLRPLN
jgi:catalase